MGTGRQEKICEKKYVKFSGGRKVSFWFVGTAGNQGLLALDPGFFRPAITRLSKSPLEEHRSVMSHMIEGAQAIWPSKKVDCSEHVCRVRDSLPFNLLGEKSAGVVYAVRLFVIKSRYSARGITQRGGFGAPQLQIEDILKFDSRKDAKHIE